LHILIKHFWDETGDKKNTIAYASSCFLGGVATQGRVKVGYVAYNLKFLK
jgi:hypothetical protein